MDIAVKFHSWIPFCNKSVGRFIQPLSLTQSQLKGVIRCGLFLLERNNQVHIQRKVHNKTKAAVVNPQTWPFSINMEAVLFSFAHLILNEINWIWTLKVGSRLKPTNIRFSLTLTLYCRSICATSSIIWNGFTREEYTVSCLNLHVISKRDLLVNDCLKTELISHWNVTV